MIGAHTTAIVVNWKLKEETLHCIQSLEQLDTPCRIIVVDNGSDDGSAEYVAQRCPGIELLALQSNLGFGSACNRAICQALRDPACEYILLLNNDAIMHPQALAELIKAAHTYSSAGIFGAKVYYSEQSATIWYAGARRRRGVFAAADTGRDQLDRGQFGTLREVDYVFGAAMLIRRSVFERIGLFDESFFLYLEDLDLCYRAQQAGFTLLFVPQALVWHKGSASTAHDTRLRRYHLSRSTIHFVRKHSSPFLFLPAIIFWMLVAVRFLVYDLVRGSIAAIRSYLVGVVTGWNEMP
jgi:GT2 family glycosyltransferase